MKNFREKAQTFLYGVTIGLLIAGSFFILKLDTYFKELNFYKSLVHTFSSESKKNETAETPEKLVVESKSKSTKYFKPESKIKSDSSNTANETLFQKRDSIPENKSDTIATLVNSVDEIVVKKDELLNTKTIEIYSLNPIAAHNNSKDSTLSKMSGILDDKNVGKDFFNVEFWQSPLNYKGYKMSKYKIILYGLPYSETQKIYKIEDAIYFKNAATIFKLDYSSEFKPLEKVNDETTLAKLK